MRSGWTLSLCLAFALPGCGAARGMQFGQNPLASITEPQVSYAAGIPEIEMSGPIENPSQLNLTYAHWMEEVGQLIEARRHYAEVVEANPKNSAVLLDATLGMARIDQQSGRMAEAEANYLTAVKIDPTSARSLDALGQFYAAGKRWPEAVESLTKATEAAPADNSYRFHLAVALAQSGDVDAAMPHFVRSVGEAEGHYNVGLILKEQGRRDDAARQFAVALDRKPDLKAARYWLDELNRVPEAAAAPLADHAPRRDSQIQPTGHSAAP